MTQVGPGPASTSSAAAAPRPSFVDWGAIIAGAVLASAISFVLLTFGTAIGLTTTSPWPNSGLSASFVAALAAFWVLVQQIGAFLAGGYVAGRMRARMADTPQDEAEFRDGLHGALVWGVGIVIGAALLLMATGAAVRTGAEIAGRAAASTNPMETVLDTMLRPTNGARAGDAQTDAEAQRAELTRLLTGAVSKGSLSGPNRTYAARVVSQRTGLPQPEAEKRVDEAVNAARDAADRARRSAVMVGLVTAVALVVSFAAAWWGAMTGGHHRDSSVPARFPFASQRVLVVRRK